MKRDERSTTSPTILQYTAERNTAVGKVMAEEEDLEAPQGSACVQGKEETWIVQAHIAGKEADLKVGT